jgi:hypothetical protein
MRLRAIPFAAAAAVLLTASLAPAQTYEMERQEQERRMDDRWRDVPPSDVRERERIYERAPLPSRALTTTDVARVEARRDQVLNRNLVGRKLTASDYRELRRQRSEVDRLISRMRAGHPVSSESVDRALGLYDQNRPGY